jgi:MOSC domain-containing protein YiiM
MKVISTNIARPREVVWDGTPVITGIYKEPVKMISIKKHFVEGDTVADLRVHGGQHKAVYGYPSEHYAYWRDEYPEMEMPWGTFGENITTEGLLEIDIFIGSVYRIGGAVLEVTEPRMPCYKLAARFGRNDIIRRFMKSRKSGFYFTVLEEGVVKPGDGMTLEKEGTSGSTIVDVVNSHDRNEQ